MNVCLTQPSNIAVNSDSQPKMVACGVDKKQRIEYNNM